MSRFQQYKRLLQLSEDVVGILSARATVVCPQSMYANIDVGMAKGDSVSALAFGENCRALASERSQPKLNTERSTVVLSKA